MAIDFIKTGESLLELGKINSKRFKVNYGKKAIKNLSSLDKNSKALFEDVFTGSKSPMVEISAKEGSKHNIAKLVTKDGNEIITDKEYVFAKNENIFDMLPQVSGRMKKVFLNKQETEKIINSDENLSNYFLPSLNKAKNPKMEIATKHNDKYDIAMLTLKDGDKVIARGAYSQSQDGNNAVKKYHFYTENGVHTGYKDNKHSAHNFLELMPEDLKRKTVILSKYLLGEKSTTILYEKFGIKEMTNMHNKSLNPTGKYYSYEEIGEQLGMTKEGIQKVVRKSIDKIKSFYLTAQMEEIFNKYSKIPKYLSRDKKGLFVDSRNAFLSNDGYINPISGRYHNEFSIHKANGQTLEDLSKLDEAQMKSKIKEFITSGKPENPRQ